MVIKGELSKTRPSLKLISDKHYIKHENQNPSLIPGMGILFPPIIQISQKKSQKTQPINKKIIKIAHKIHSAKALSLFSKRNVNYMAMLLYQKCITFLMLS